MASTSYGRLKVRGQNGQKGSITDAKDIAVLLFPLLLFIWTGHVKAHGKNTNTSISMHWRLIPKCWLRDDKFLFVILWLLEIPRNNISAQATTCLKTQNERMITMARIVGTQWRTDGTEIPTALWNETIMLIGLIVDLNRSMVLLAAKSFCS